MVWESHQFQWALKTEQLVACPPPSISRTSRPRDTRTVFTLPLDTRADSFPRETMGANPPELSLSLSPPVLKQACLAELRLHSVALNAAKLKNDELLSHLIMPLYYPAIYHFDSRNNLLERNRFSGYSLYSVSARNKKYCWGIVCSLFLLDEGSESGKV